MFMVHSSFFWTKSYELEGSLYNWAETVHMHSQIYHITPELVQILHIFQPERTKLHITAFLFLS